ncbi:hypothetical protein SAMN05444007_103385 [Cribrihabitans marinus]|uniref:Uncharacterized protein n=1 Tax=Cribrihabitans marinus TaxID=1227549 RepID=A0A1H6W724_9RHOB|nr:hypothetical protein SAMN05444007_103385 [Cribrihabitans marinus]
MTHELYVAMFVLCVIGGFVTGYELVKETMRILREKRND